MQKPLEGYTVIDLTTYVAAPVCARFLGEMGARVIKIESPKGDAWRGTGVSLAPNRFTQEENPIFSLYNSGKDMICLNLKTQEGMAIMHRLLEKADIFITNNRPAALERLGLHYNQLKERYPRLIYGIVLGFGEKGPDADKPAFDTTAFWSRSGFLVDTASLTEDYHPVMAPAGVGDSYTGTNLAMQILAAVLQRQLSGRGQYVKSSLYHIGAFAMSTMTVKSQRPFGQQLPMARWQHKATSGAFCCADGEWIYLSGFKPERLFEITGNTELLKDPIWKDENAKTEAKARYEVMKALLMTKNRDEWMTLLEPYGSSSVKMAHFADVSEDEQAWANGFVEKVAYPNYTHIVPTAPFDMEDMKANPTEPNRRKGQDTQKVLEELGYTQEQIDKLSQEGAVIV